MNQVNEIIKRTANKMHKPYSENLIDEPLISLNIGYSAIEVLILIKIISESLDVDYKNILDFVKKEEITYNSVSKLFLEAV